MMKYLKVYSAFLGVVTAALFSTGCGGGGTDIVIADFEGDNWGGWKTTGQSFGDAPANGGLDGQRPVSGFDGNGLANSFHEGEKAQGSMLSPFFTIQRPYITFLIGGGDIEGETCINLVVNGEIVRTQAGSRNDSLTAAYWEVGDFKGTQAHIEIVDSYSGDWGYVLADQIVQSMAANPGTE